jgi:hypothetical protein
MLRSTEIVKDGWVGLQAFSSTTQWSARRRREGVKESGLTGNMGRALGEKKIKSPGKRMHAV